jgi:hypothetical protein
MKYMTPDLLAKFRSQDDDVADAAAAEWEKQCDAYKNHLKEIRNILSPGARRLLHRNFHDAKVLTLATDDEMEHCSIFLEFDDPDNPKLKKSLELKYRLVSGGQGFALTKHPAVDDGKELGWWLYDEFDVTPGDVPIMTHSILLTGGWEICLKFFRVSSCPTNIWSFDTTEGIIDPKRTGIWKPRIAPVRSACG